MAKSTKLKIGTLQPGGILDAMSSKQLFRQVQDLLDLDHTVILLNCQDLEFVDSSGLGMLVRILKTVEQSDARLCLCSIPEEVQLLLQMTKMEDVFEIFASPVHFRLVMDQA